MKSKTLLGALCGLALILAACAPAATPAPTLVPTTVVTEPPVTQSPVATESPVATDTPSTNETATIGVPVTGEATVNVATVGTHDSVLVNGDGKPLYVFSKDTGTTSACTGDCTSEWIPLATQGSPVAGTGVDATLLGTITRDDVTMQVTYNGHPLYTFVDDTGSDNAAGQGMQDNGATWTLIASSGDPVEQ
jgi:predicted lipoprotein with Yx(FWY)xxD motif